MVRSSIEECCFASHNRDIGTRKSARQTPYLLDRLNIERCPNPIRSEARVDRPSQRDRRHRSRTRGTQGFGALVQRRSRGKHIVNEQDSQAGEGLRSTDHERTAQVSKTLLPGERRLWFRGEHAYEIGGGDRPLEVPPQTVGDQQGLVEFTGSQSGRMQWDRNNEIDIELLRQGADHQRGQGLRKAKDVPILECTDRVLKRWNVGIERPGPRVDRRVLKAPLTAVSRRPYISRVRGERLIAVGAPRS